MNKIIEAEGLTKVYPPNTKAVDQVSFSVDEGEIFGFLGPNGAGKTTTIKMLTTLASISEGRCSVAGYDVKSQQKEVRRAVGLVPQEAAVDTGLTGLENLLLSARLYGIPSTVAKEKAKQLLELVGLDEASQRMVRTYSSGMRKRLELISGLIHEPRVLFLDEPTLGLDVQTRTLMWEYIKGVNEEKNTTIFLTTHYLEEADSLSERVAIIDHGQIKVSGAPSELKSELGRDILEIKVSTDSELTQAISSMNGFSEVKRTSTYTYSIGMPRIERSLQSVFNGLSKLGVNVIDAKLEKPNLDTVFLNVTGRSIRDEVVDSGDSFAARARAESARH
jgi:ABC-2 type transport system ATP-binding protein